MVGILYATNRNQFPDFAGVPQFSSDIATDRTLTWGRFTIDDGSIDLSEPSSGTVTATSPPTLDMFAPADVQPILASENDILVFVHGCANTFDDAVKRAAYNQKWLSQANIAGAAAAFDVIAYTWPARSYDFLNPFDDYNGYRHDQTVAQGSVAGFAMFLSEFVALRPQLLATPGGRRRRINLLCHSMGNFMLGWAIDPMFVQDVPGPGVVFDQIVLAAADELRDTFGPPLGHRLSRLSRIGAQIAVYFSRDDLLMKLSREVNGQQRLGYDGPPNMADLGFFPAPAYSFVDCSGCNDYIAVPLEDQLQQTHQYYRASPTVRADIAATLAGVAANRPALDPASNAYKLFGG
jgi:esterase/lipase superfamily enzyme